MGSAHDPAAIARAACIDPELVGKCQRHTIKIIGESKAIHLDAEPNIFMMYDPIDFESKRMTG